MLRIVFKNLERSELAKQIVTERFEDLAEKFPDLLQHRVVFTLEMENSPLHPGPDSFRVTLQVKGARYRFLSLHESAENLYLAVSRLMEGTLERLNRAGDKARVRSRRQSRKIMTESPI